MSGDDWDEEKTKMKIKSALLPLCAREGTTATINEILAQCQSALGQRPPYEKFGYNRLSDFMRQHPDFFVGQGDNWTYNENCLTSIDHTIINDIRRSNPSKSRRGGGRGGAPRGRGGSTRGGYLSAFNSRPQSFNHGRAPASSFANNDNFYEHENRFSGPPSNFGNYRNVFSGNDGGFSGSSSYAPEDPYDNRQSFNNMPRSNSPERYNNSRNGRYGFGEPMNRNNYNEDSYRPSCGYNDDYPQDTYNEPPRSNGNVSNDYRRNNFDDDRYPRNESYRNDGGFDSRYVDTRRRSPSPITRSESAYYPPPRSSPPPGMEPDYSYPSRPTPPPRHTPPPGLGSDHYVKNEVSVGPPPGLNDTNVRSVNSLENRPRSVASEGSVTASNEGKMTIGHVAQSTVRVLCQVWPKSLELRQVFDYPGIFPAGFADNYTEDSIKTALEKVLKRLNKPGLKELVHIDREGDKTFLIYNVDIDNTSDLSPEYVFKVVINYLNEMGPQTLSRLAKILGIENKGGTLGAAELLFFIQSAPKWNEIVKIEKVRERVVSLIENATVELWRPKAQESLSPERLPPIPPPSPKPELTKIPPPHSSDLVPPDFQTMFKAAKLLASSTALKYFRADYLPYFDILQRNGLPKDFNKTIMNGVISNFVDFNNFWLRNENDDVVYNQLMDELIEYYKACGEPKEPKVGQMVAACRYNDSENWWYIRGIVLEKSRKYVLIRNIDEGGITRSKIEDIYPLPEYFSKLPPLATRCSIGKFREMTEEEIKDLEDEERHIGERILRRTVSFKLRNIVEGEHILIEVEVPIPGGRVKMIPQEYDNFMAKI